MVSHFTLLSSTPVQLREGREELALASPGGAASSLPSRSFGFVIARVLAGPDVQRREIEHAPTTLIFAPCATRG
jgi:hypothetical protein